MAAGAMAPDVQTLSESCSRWIWLPLQCNRFYMSSRPALSLRAGEADTACRASELPMWGIHRSKTLPGGALTHTTCTLLVCGVTNSRSSCLCRFGPSPPQPCSVNGWASGSPQWTQRALLGASLKARRTPAGAPTPSSGKPALPNPLYMAMTVTSSVPDYKPDRVVLQLYW